MEILDYIRTLLEQQPLMALFLTIAIGYLVGEINIKGFSLGVGAVLFVALGMGWFAPKAVPAPMVGTLGLALFLYAVGVQYGKQFFIGLVSPAGRRANMMALVGVLSAGAVSILFVKMMGLNVGHALGLFAGSGTSTPTLQAAIATLGNDDPAVGYSVAYPFGVAGPILFLYIAFMVLKPKIEAPSGSGMEVAEIVAKHPDAIGRTIAELMSRLPADAQILTRQFKAIQAFDVYDRLPAIQAPTLVVASTGDVLIPPGNSDLLAARIPHARLVATPGGGHQILVEQPEACNRAVVDFLKTLASPA